MFADRLLIDRVARSDSAQDLPFFVPPTDHPVIHLGTIGDVDLGQNTVTYQWNHPSGQVTAGVPVLLPYSAIHVPAAGHLVRLLQYGSMTMILGRQLPPNAPIVI